MDFLKNIHNFDPEAAVRNLQSKQDDKQVDPIDGFMDALLEAKFEVSSLVITGLDKVERCKVDGSREQVGWYSCQDFGDYFVAVYKDWREYGEPHKYTGTKGTTLTPDRRKEIAELQKQAKLVAERQKRAEQDIAAVKAREIFANAKQVTEHEYLKKKQVCSYGLKVDSDGNLLVPLVDATGAICSLEYIAPNGKKWVLTNGKLKGCYHTVGTLTSDRTVYVTEGYSTAATIHEATGKMVVCTRNAGNLPVVIDELKSKAEELGINFVVAADNDHETELEGKGNAGLSAAQTVEIKHNIPYLAPSNIEGVSDFNDLYEVGGKEAVEMALKVGKFKPETNEAFPILPHYKTDFFDVDDYQEMTWLIKGVIPEHGMGMIFGPSGQYKSFLTLDLVMHMAHGMDWHGHRVKEPVPILYIIGEGQLGFAERGRGWLYHHGMKRASNIIRSNMPIDGTDRQHINRIVLDATEKLGTPPKLIVFDTLNRNFGDGDENSSQDMKKFIDNLDFMRHSYGCSSLIVHHSGTSDPKRARGSTALKGAVDYSFNIYVPNIELAQEGNEEPIIRFVVDKQKDGEGIYPKEFARKVVTLGKASDGEPRTTLVIKPSVAPESQDWSVEAESGTTCEAVVFRMFKSVLRERLQKNGREPAIATAKEMAVLYQTSSASGFKRNISGFSDDKEKQKAQIKRKFNYTISRLVKQGVVKKMGEHPHLQYQLMDKNLLKWLVK